jgi:hypothetical protein
MVAHVPTAYLEYLTPELTTSCRLKVCWAELENKKRTKENVGKSVKDFRQSLNITSLIVVLSRASDRILSCISFGKVPGTLSSGSSIDSGIDIDIDIAAYVAERG